MFNPFELNEDNMSKPEPRDPFGRIPLAQTNNPDSEIKDLGNPSSLSQSVGSTGKNQRRDVAKAETMLGAAGALDLKKTDGPTGYWGLRTEDATKKFQKQNGLKVDGLMNPGGETIRALAKVAGNALKTVMQKKTENKLVTPAQAGAQGAVKDALPVDGDLANPAIPKSPALSAEQSADNGRTAAALRKIKGVGDLPRFTSDAINTHGDKAIHEVADLIGQVHAHDPAQAKELFDKTAEGIAEDQRPLLVRAFGQRLGTETRGQGTVRTMEIRGDEPSSPPEHAIVRDRKPVEIELRDAKTSGDQDAGTPPAGTSSAPVPGDPGTSQDEHGNWFDKDGQPIANQGKSPNVQQAQFAVPTPGLVPPPPGMVGQPTPEDIQRMMDRYGREFRDWWNEKTNDAARTDQAPQLPNQETYPADQPDPEDGIHKGRPAEPDRAINPPPFEMPKTGQFDGANTPPSEDQSGDPDLGGPQILEIKKLPESIDQSKTDHRPEDYQKVLGGMTAEEQQVLKDVGFTTHGVITHADGDAANINTDLSPEQMKGKWREIAQGNGIDPTGPAVRPIRTTNGEPSPGFEFDTADGSTYQIRDSTKGHGTTLDIVRPYADAGNKRIYEFKYRATNNKVRKP